MGVTEFTPEAATSGWISLRGRTYTVNTSGSTITGWAFNPFEGNTEYRGYLNFDTNNGIPANAVVDKVELKISVFGIVKSGTNPSDWKNDFAIGTFIGLALGRSDWNGGTVVCTHDWESPDQPVDKVTVDLGTLAPQYYNNSGDTDIRISDNSDYSAKNGTFYYVGTTSAYRLIVHWHLPQVVTVINS